MNIRDLLAEASTALQPTSPSARLDAELLLAHVLGWSRARVLAERDVVLTEEQRAAFTELVGRRKNLEPVAYLVGHKEFYGLDFMVDRRVLVPRPETELLVDLAIAWGRARKAVQLADIGTGSGCVAVVVAVHLPTAHIQAADISPDALDVARINVRRHGVEERVELLEGDLLEPTRGPLDLIVSNPPYTILCEVDEGVRRHEPRLALDGGADGTDLYERLLREALEKLAPGGAFLAEIGAWQGPALVELSRRIVPRAAVRLHQDLAGRDRVLEVNLGEAR